MRTFYVTVKFQHGGTGAYWREHTHRVDADGAAAAAAKAIRATQVMERKRKTYRVKEGGRIILNITVGAKRADNPKEG